MKIRKLSELVDIASKLYDSEASIREWLEALQPLELAKLWHETCVINKSNPFGAGYDDEVYESLKILGYFN